MVGLFQLLQPGDHHGSFCKVKTCWWLVHVSPSPQPLLCQSRDADFRQFEVLAAGKAVSILFDSAFAVLIYDYLISFLVLWFSPLERSWVPYKCGRSWRFCFFFFFKTLLKFSPIVVLLKAKPQTWILKSEATYMLGKNARKLNI